MTARRGRRRDKPLRIGTGLPGPGVEARADDVAEPLAFRVSPAERATIDAAVHSAGARSRSDWIREVTLAAAQAQRLLSGARAPAPLNKGRG